MKHPCIFALPNANNEITCAEHDRPILECAEELNTDNKTLQGKLDLALDALKLVDKEHRNQENWVDLPASHHRVSRARFITADERRAVTHAIDSMRDRNVESTWEKVAVILSKMKCTCPPIKRDTKTITRCSRCLALEAVHGDGPDPVRCQCGELVSAHGGCRNLRPLR